MSEFFEQFQAFSKHKVDPEVCLRWEYDARFFGDRNIRKQIANAKRTATSLLKAREHFVLLSAENSDAIKSAISTMHALVAELESLKVWALDYKHFCDAESAQIRNEQLEAVAFKRWGATDEKLLFECAIINELSTKKGRVLLGNWMLSRGLHPNVAHDCFISPISSVINLDSINFKLHAAQIIDDLLRDHFAVRTLSFNGQHVHCSFPDYEEYLAYRCAVAKTSALIVGMAKVG